MLVDVEVAAADKVDVVVAALGEVEEMDRDTVEESSPPPNVNKTVRLIDGKM